MYNQIHYYISKLCGFSNSPDGDRKLQDKEDLEDDMDEKFFDVENGSELDVSTNIVETCNQINDKNVLIEQRLKTLEELYRNEKDKQTTRELQLQRFEERYLINLSQTSEIVNMRELSETVQKLQTTVEKQQLTIDKKNSYYEELLKENIKALEELYRAEGENKESRKLQMNSCNKCCLMNSAQISKVTDMRELSETVQKLQTTVEKQQLTIDKKNNYCEELLKENIKTLEELYRVEGENKESRKLQMNSCNKCCLMNSAQIFKVTDMRELSETVQKLQTTVDKQQLMIEKKNNFDEELNILKLNMKTVQNDLNTMITNINELRTQMISIEREVTKNSTHIIGMNYSFQALSLTRPDLGAGAAVPLAKSNFEPHLPNTSSSSSSFVTIGSSSSHHALNLSPPPPLLPPNPPMTTVSTAYVPSPPPPPPPMMQTAGVPKFQSKVKETVTSASKTAEPTYYRIPITEEILKSVVLKPPGQRKVGKKFLTK